MARRGPSPQAVLAIASLGSAVAFVDATIVNIAFPDIARSFRGTSIASLSWVLNAYNIVFAAFLVAAGRIADLLGRRRLFVFGLELFTAASGLCAIAPSPGALIAFRVVQALGAACLVPASLALVLNAFAAERRAHGVALLSAVAAAAAGLGPSLGGVLVAASGWRLVFLVNLPIGVAAAVLARRRLVESRTPGRRRLPDLTGAVLFAIAVGALVLAVVQGQDWGWGSWRIIAAFAVAAGFGAVFVWRCTWHRSPIVDLSLLRIRTFSVANSLTIVGAAGFYGYTLANVLFLTGVWRYSVLRAGLALSIGPLVAVIIAGPASRVVARVGHRPVLVAGGLIWSGGVVWLAARAGVHPDFAGVWVPAMIILGLGAGILFPNLSGVAVASAPGESFATATGMNAVARQVGAALGVALIVAILGTPAPAGVLAAFRHAWIFGAACLFAAGAGSLLIARLYVAPGPGVAEAARDMLADRRAAADRPPAPRPPRATDRPARPAAGPRAESAADFLARTPIFSRVDDDLRRRLAARTTARRLEAGEWLFREGEEGDAMFLVRAGRLEVVDESAGAVIRQLGRGDEAGELSLLTGAPRSASVRAARGTDVIAIDRHTFDEVLESSPALALTLTRALARQLRETRAPAPAGRPRPATVALVALGDDVPLGPLAESLSLAVAAHRSAALLTGDEVAAPDPGATPAAAYGPLLDLAEAEHDLVVLAAGSALGRTRWTEFCLQQADRVLGVTAGGPVPEALGEVAELQGCDLVLHQPSGELAGWAAVLDPAEAHLVRGGERERDLARLARRLSGASLGVVLSGGGARAFAHIGVLEELLAAGLEIDRVAGVSMGAVIGALFAMGRDPDEIDAICFEEWVQRRPLSDYTLPRHSLIRGERFRAMLHRVFGTTLIEELPVSFMCGSTELRSGRLAVARHGPLWEAVGFSICLPVIAPPQVRGREMFVDGSLVDNLPVRTMAEMGEGPIIAVDVKASFDRSPGEAGQAGGARSANGRPHSARERIPSLGETLARVLLLGSQNTTEAAERHADLVIKPRAPGVGLLEFHQLDAAREAGRVAAREALEQAPGLV